MSDTILDSVALAYQPVWNARRQLAAVRLRVLAVNPDAVDGAHLMHVLGEDWPAAAPLLSLSFVSPAMCAQALTSEAVDNTWIEVPAGAFEVPETLAHLTAAVQRGHRLLRVTTLTEARSERVAPLEVRSLLLPTAEEALEALRSRPMEGVPPPASRSPVLPGQIYQGIGCRALADHCLDEALAWGLAGWPEDDVLHGWRHRSLVGAATTIREVQQAIDQDASLEQLERHLRQDPVLVYRLLTLVNSPAYGLTYEIESLRHAIMMVGFTALYRWLGEQKTGSETDEDLHPVRFAQVMRARLAQHLLDSGSEEVLRAEVYLTALFSQLDRLMQQPLGPLLHKLPLSGRLFDAVLRQQGPYFPLLDIASAQGDLDRLGQLPEVCKAHGMPLEQANRALLRMIATTRDQVHPPREHPWSQARN